MDFRCAGPAILMATYTIHPRTGEILTPRRPAGDRAAIEISALSDMRKLKPSPRRLPPTSTSAPHLA